MALTEYTPNKENIKSAISQMLEIYIYNCDEFTPEEKVKVAQQLGRKFREQIDVDYLLDSCVSRTYENWKDENLEQAKLWKDIAVANASHSNSPAATATNTVKEFNKQFNPE